MGIVLANEVMQLLFTWLTSVVLFKRKHRCSRQPKRQLLQSASHTPPPPPPRSSPN